MSATVIVRPATAADAPRLGQLGASLVALHHEFDPSRFIAPGRGTERGYGRFLAEELRRPGVVVLVAERAGMVAGYAYAAVEGQDWMSLRGPAGVIHDIVVDPEHRRQGVGAALLAATIDALSAQGAPRFVLSTAARNESARRFFAAAGFRPTMIEMTAERRGADEGGS
ncbi:GNAT family N-acetyltransferase [Salinarimonas soli]|uniref:GNAT family N-acetyltransferase n=1 Tax=Salinarimonas soli TaxID=1638099 RepID=A0A5B2W0V7_9HYPH|nr:GNAT family N-acetyltransferase [Salinarimonas soli]KAA2244047.1 GNAT family N-acetyltransferase [Salinarimonas soli]